MVTLVEEQTRIAGHAPFVAFREIAQREMSQASQFMPFVRAQIQSSDLILLLYEIDLRGGLIEAGLAYAFRIPIWLCYREGERVSSSVLGCADIVISYNNLSDLKEKLSEAYRSSLPMENHESQLHEPPIS